MVAMVAWVAFECNRCGHPSLALWSLVGGRKEFAKPRPFADVQSSLRVQVSFPFLPGPSLLLGKVFFFLVGVAVTGWTEENCCKTAAALLLRKPMEDGAANGQAV
jgi:hypothetical protein